MSKMDMSKCCYREYIQGIFRFMGIVRKVLLPVSRSIQLPLSPSIPISTQPYGLCTQVWGFLYSSKIIGTFSAPFQLFLSFVFIVCFIRSFLFACFVHLFCSLAFFAYFLRLLSSLVLSLVLSLVFIACFL